MTDEITTEVIKKTQESLSKFIKRPPLTEKLLKKPPFRFLHDIVTNVINETGFLNGLYSATEMQSENIKDREMKIAFLQKLIDAIKIVTVAKISARPSKIIAGLEPNKTNQLLQMIGLALEKNLDSTDAVHKITGVTVEPSKNAKKESKVKKEIKNDEKGKSKKIEEPKKLLRRNTEEKLIVKKKSPRIEKENRKNSGAQNERKNKEKMVRQEIKEGETITKEIQLEAKIKSPERKEIELEAKIKGSPERSKTPELSKELPSIEPEVTPKDFSSIPEEKPVEPIVEIFLEPKNPSPKPEPMITKKEIPSRAPNSLRPPSVRPSSARPGAPRLKERNDTILPPDQLIPLGKVNVIVEDFNNKSELDDEETVVLETQIETPAWPTDAIPDTIPAEKGHLVSQILEQIGEAPVLAQPRAQIKWEQKAGDAGSVKLRQNIQTLTRAANPLGKLIHFLHEDVDSMQAELKMWIEVNDKLRTEIKSKKRQNEESMKPLQDQLSRIENDIIKQIEMISNTQANILKNQQKIKSLLTRD